MSELAAVLETISGHRRSADGRVNTSDFADIHAAFALLRTALDQPDPHTSTSPRPAATRPYTDDRYHKSAAAGGRSFDDIYEIFTDLRRTLGLPPPDNPSHSTTTTPSRPDDTYLLGKAVAEARACAGSYQDTAEWQRIGRIGQAARDLAHLIREAAGDYWAELQQDARAHGFARTIAARVCLAISGNARILASRLEHAGHQDTRAWRAISGLHRSAATFARSILGYQPPGDRINNARRIIDELRGPASSQAEPPESPAGARRRATTTSGPVSLASTGFPPLVAQAEIHRTAPRRHSAPQPGRHRHARPRQ